MTAPSLPKIPAILISYHHFLKSRAPFGLLIPPPQSIGFKQTVLSLILSEIKRSNGLKMHSKWPKL